MAGDIKVPIPSLPEADKVLKTDQIIFQGSTKTQRCTLAKLLTDLRIANPDMNPDDVLGMIIPNNAGAHNSIYRGKNLGTRVTEAQWAEIKAGTFRDLFIGDYWTINSVTYRIAGFNYWWNCGDTAFTKNHLAIVPDGILYTQKMNETNTTEGGYVNSLMRKSGLEKAKTMIKAAFGANHVLSHQEHLTNAVTNGKPNGGAWFDSDVELMNEPMVYGSHVFAAGADGITVPMRNTVDKSQLPLFQCCPWLISNRQWFWLRDVVSSVWFAAMFSYGNTYYYAASNEVGVRPVFPIG